MHSYSVLTAFIYLFNLYMLLFHPIYIYIYICGLHVISYYPALCMCIYIYIYIYIIENTFYSNDE